MTDAPTVDESARRLYGTQPGEFVAARQDEVRRLREDGHGAVAKEVARLRRPSVAAALVDATVRRRPDLADDVGKVGRRLRTVSSDAEAAPAAVRAVDDDRRSVVRRCVEAAGEVAQAWGSPASAATLREVEQTFWAAAVDAGALAAVRAGCLVRTLSPSGFGAVDTTGASAIEVAVGDEPLPARPRRPARTARRETAKAPAPEPEPDDDAALRRARDDLAAAELGLHDAEREAAAATEQATATEHRAKQLEQELAELRRRLTDLEQEVRDAAADQRRAAAERQSAERHRRDASRAADRARRRLEQHDA